MFEALKALSAAAVAIATLLGAAQAQQEKRFDVDNFDRIDVSAGIVLIAEVGEPKSVIVKTDKGDFKDLDLKVRNGELHVTRDWNRLRWHSKKSAYKVIVSTPNLRSLEASSGSHAKISNVSAPRFVIDLSSGAHASVEGACDDCTVDLSSGAHLDAKDLACGTVRLDVSSGGFGKISANNAVIADASSGGHFTVYGNPERVSIDKSSGGRVHVASSSHSK
jgi:hypothetical protein